MSSVTSHDLPPTSSYLRGDHVELRDRLGQTIVIVTHDERLAAMADRRITMSDGRIL